MSTVEVEANRDDQIHHAHPIDHRARTGRGRPLADVERPSRALGPAGTRRRDRRRPEPRVPVTVGRAEATKGNLRGSRFVKFALGVPLLAVSAARGGRSALARMGWLGATAYLLYQGVLFCFAIPMTSLFLLSVAWLGLGVWTLGTLLHTLDPGAVRVANRFPGRGIAVLLAPCSAQRAGLAGARRPHDRRPPTSAVLTVRACSRTPCGCGPRLLDPRGPGRRRPALAWPSRGRAARRGPARVPHRRGSSVAMDQWFGWRANPTVPDVASLSVVPMFLVLTLVTGLPLLWFARDVRLSGAPPAAVSAAQSERVRRSRRRGRPRRTRAAGHVADPHASTVSSSSSTMQPQEPRRRQ